MRSSAGMGFSIVMGGQSPAPPPGPFGQLVDEDHAAHRARTVDHGDLAEVLAVFERVPEFATGGRRARVTAMRPPGRMAICGPLGYTALPLRAAEISYGE